MPPAEIVDEDEGRPSPSEPAPAGRFLPSPREGGGGGLVHDPQDLEAGEAPRLGEGPPLEIRKCAGAVITALSTGTRVELGVPL